MAKFILTSCLVFIISLGFTQNDKVFLKNGSKIRGTVNSTLRDTIVVTIDESEITLPLALVEEVRFKRRDFGKPDNYRVFSYKQGYFATIKGGVLLGNPAYNGVLEGFLMLEGVFEYHHHAWLNVGVGGGVNFYKHYTITPLYIQYQALFGKMSKSFFVYGQAGHGLIYSNEHNPTFRDVKAGRLLACGVGFQNKAGKGAFRYQLGIQSQRVKELEEPLDIWGWQNKSMAYLTRIRDMNRIILTVGYTF